MKRALVWRAAFAVAVFGAFAGARAFADYVVVLKSGSVLMAKEPYAVEGKRAMIRGLDGHLVSVALSDIDEERTREANAAGAVVTPNMTTPPPAEPPPAESPNETVPQSSGAPGKSKVIDNYSLSQVQGKINVGPGGDEEEGKEKKSEGEEAKPLTVEELRSKEQEIHKIVEAINAKVKESVERGAGNLPAQKKLEAEINEMRATYDKEWKAYTESVEKYNTNLPGAMPPAPGEGEGEGEAGTAAAEAEKTEGGEESVSAGAEVSAAEPTPTEVTEGESPEIEEGETPQPSETG